MMCPLEKSSRLTIFKSRRSQLRQRQRELHASQEQSLTRFLLELPNGLPQIPAHELRVPIGPVEVLDRVTMQVDDP